mmetsp:Transcript_6082/g.15455  ORF Transcript_6082/g.15455 Transcript_6082/m.15455 type:complete len:166 (+) Transcript_6082:61-558(+)
MLQAADRANGEIASPKLSRVDTVINFEGTIGSTSVDVPDGNMDNESIEMPPACSKDVSSATQDDAPTQPTLRRFNTVERVGALDVVADAFEAVETAGLSTPRLAPGSNADSCIQSGANQMMFPQVRRVDTLELLEFPANSATAPIGMLACKDGDDWTEAKRAKFD